MKRTLMAGAAFAAGAALAAALSASPASAQELTGTLKNIKETGTITLGYRDSSIPFSYLDDNQKPVGYAMDICYKIVDAVKMVGMRMGHDNRVEAADLGVEQLLAHIGRGVDQHGLTATFDEDRGASAAVARVDRGQAVAQHHPVQRAAALGLRPRARIVASAVCGDDPTLMLTGPIPATHKVLARSGLELGQIDAVEINEAFAPVPLAWLAEFPVDPALVNPRGGAIALGHPLGASGVRLLTTLLNQLETTGGRYGLQTMCEAGGMANALILERLG